MTTTITSKKRCAQHRIPLEDGSSRIIDRAEAVVGEGTRLCCCRTCWVYECHERIRRRRQRKHVSRSNREGTTTRASAMKLVMMAAFGITLSISVSTAFVVVSPTTINPIDSPNSYPSGLASSSPSYRLHDRIIHRRQRSILRAAASDDKKPESNQKNQKPRKSSNKGSNSNRNRNNNKKPNKGGHKYKKSKTSTTSSSSSSPAKKKAYRKKKKPLDPSKQKKQEIMEQIKAKIKEEGEEKKRKQNQNQKQKPAPSKKNQQQRPKPKQTPSRPKKNAPSTQARLQNLAEEDPPESLFDDDNNDENSKDESTKRKKLFMNPFEAGKSFRETLNNLSTLSRGLQLPKETKQKYFLDDRLLDGDDEPGNLRSNGALFSSSPLLQSNFNSKTANSLLQEYAEAEAMSPIAYIPEVLVVGATGEIGRLVVRRLLLEGSGRFRVRVLVRDLYSQTLNLLGTGVSYCQGDLNDIESLEYALTDVDKIVYVAGAPKPDESDFQQKFQLYLEEHDMELSASKDGANEAANTAKSDLEWEQLASVLEVRSELAEQVDCVGMKNLVSAYQNVRHTDYGTSQAAKRSLFKFSKKSGDFDLFALDDGDDESNSDDNESGNNGEGSYEESYAYGDEEYDNDRYEYDDEHEGYDEDSYIDEYGDYDEEYGLELESRSTKDANIVKAQVQWLRNKFDKGVFVGRVPRADATNPSANPGGEASIISSRLQAREDPNQGIDMINFAGFILRIVSDGNNYEAFVRTELYETDGVEYVYQFSTDSKKPTADNFSRNRFKTIRLAFDNFKPVQRKKSKIDANEEGDDDNIVTVPPFVGSDVRYLGFRFRSSSNTKDDTASSQTDRIRDSLERLSGFRKSERDKVDHPFYMALSYIKVYRSQPEPEFIYLSDARIPPVIHDGMVHHQRKVLQTDDDALVPNRSEQEQPQQQQPQDGSAASETRLFDEKYLQRKSRLERSPEETYFKYRGEEILIKSGLSYTIIRVAGFNELSTSEASTIDLVKSNTETTIVPVSRAEVAQVCVSALLDPFALNKCVYMTKKSVAGKNVLDEEDISAKFEGIPTDVLL